MGTSENDSVQCHTDLKLCCSGSHGPHRGDWYFPDGTRLPFFSGVMNERRGAQRVDLHQTSATGPTGIYRCDIPTDDVQDTYISLRDTVYVGLYAGSRGKRSPLLKLLC